MRDRPRVPQGRDIEIARDIIGGRLPASADSGRAAVRLTPVSFREIDGRELARQYVAHRRLLDTERHAAEIEKTPQVEGAVTVRKGTPRRLPARSGDDGANWLLRFLGPFGGDKSRR